MCRSSGARRVVVLVVVAGASVRDLEGEEAGVAAIGAGDQRRGGPASLALTRRRPSETNW